MTDFVQLIVSGVQNGMAYALVGLALVLIFQTTRVLNFAQGTMSSIGGFVAYDVIVIYSNSWILGAIAAVLAGILAAALVERVAIRPLLGSPHLSLVIATVAVDSMLSNAIQLKWGADINNLPPPLPGSDFVFNDVYFSRTYLVIIVVTVVLLGIMAMLLKRTTLGLTMKAFADDQFAAELQGISPGKMSAMAWMLAGAIGGLTGILFGPLLYIQLGYMNPVFIYGFTAAVVGGLISQVGAIAGGIVLGVVEVMAIAYAPPGIASMLPLLAILAVLLLRPAGLVSRSGIERNV